MRVTRFRIRTLMIAVAVAAALFLRAVAFSIHPGWIWMTGALLVVLICLLVNCARPRLVVRMTTRRWMIVVAVVACLFAAGRIREDEARRTRYRFLARFHAFGEDLHAHPEKYDGRYLGVDRPPFRANRRLDPALAAYHAQLKGKYQLAARHPWLAVPPDPPPPK
jgi:hypothetical protein